MTLSMPFCRRHAVSRRKAAHSADESPFLWQISKHGRRGTNCDTWRDERHCLHAGRIPAWLIRTPVRGDVCVWSRTFKGAADEDQKAGVLAKLISRRYSVSSSTAFLLPLPSPLLSCDLRTAATRPPKSTLIPFFFFFFFFIWS